MTTKSRRRWGPLAAVTALVMCLAGGTALSELASAPGRAGPAKLSYTSRAISPKDADVVNSGRGQYYWLEVPPEPTWWAAPDVYFRDQIQWGRTVERIRGVYDFSQVERGLTMAKERGGRFSFRVMAFCPGCGGNLAPRYVPVQASGAPDWNSEEFLSGWERLMNALGKRYNNDPRLGYLDIGGYGAAGEWYFRAEYGTKITPENARRVMKAVINAFPDKPKMVNWIDGWPEVATALGSKVGIRIDCIGGFENTYRGRTPEVDNAWKTAPMVGEWCYSPATTMDHAIQNIEEFHLSHLSSGNRMTPYDQLSPRDQRLFREANSILGYRYSLDQVDFDKPPAPGRTVGAALRWSNGGVAPTYDEWTPTLQLQDNKGRVVWSQDVPIDLRTLTGGSQTVGMKARLPSGLSGRYDLSVIVRDPSGYLRPMALAQQGRSEDGAFSMGSVILRSGRG